MSTEREGAVCEYIEIMQIPPRFASEGRAWIKRTNGVPARVARFDPVLTNHTVADAGWILTGGY